MEKLIISNTPHVRAKGSTKRIMIDVMLALVPALVMGCVYFGLYALLVVVLALFSAVASEIVYRLIVKEKFKDILHNFDFTSAVTGLLLGLNLPPSCPWYVPILGGVFAVVVVKMLFGGTGKNFVNPAIAARVFLLISFAEAMTTWGQPNIGAINPLQNAPTDVSTGATVLGSLFKGDVTMSNVDLLLGTGLATGAIGETCKVALIVGYLYLVIRRVIDFKYPLIYIGIAGLIEVMMQGSFSVFLPSILSGGLMLGAIFMATDYVTTPNTTLGNVIYFVLLGVVTGLLRHVKGAEVVSYCILLMNFIVPLIDRFIVPKPFGYQKPEKEVQNGEK